MSPLRIVALWCLWILTSSTVLTTALAAERNSSAYQPRPYTIDIDQSFIETTRHRLRTFRPTLDIAQPFWADGPPALDIQALANVWAEEYDWLEEQSYINNNFSHYMITLPSPCEAYDNEVDIHFIHAKSSRADAVPLLMLHGWPSTSLEWEKIIPDLVDPNNQNETAFHIIAPDLPGYGFSPAPIAPGLGASEHSTIFASLMRQLGYNQYAVYSTDLGWVIGITMVVEQAQNVVNHVTDFYVVAPNATDLERYAANQTSFEESNYIEAANAFFTHYSAYAAIHSTLPLSIAFALNDSPVGALAWVSQIMYTASDKVLSATQLIRQTLLMYIPGVYGNIRSYKELYPVLESGEIPKSTVPTSVLQFGSGGSTGYPEIYNFNFVPLGWIERTANVTHFARHATGGHFPAESEPQLVIEELRTIFQK